MSIEEMQALALIASFIAIVANLAIFTYWS